eukprot:TRINITY_DN1044_c0_g1_i4.p2 TRINITY_DN1044_c0_g1~~TRINITY_DN1044_c0_g1_i4.p2  ORF type:complete len:123 (+),score=29.90 TRINITY_DN1044_c0_g1_i4:94-462(+)
MPSLVGSEMCIRDRFITICIDSKSAQFYQIETLYREFSSIIPEYISIIRDLKSGALLPEYVERAKIIKSMIYKDDLLEKALQKQVEILTDAAKKNPNDMSYSMFALYMQQIYKLFLNTKDGN